MEMRKKVKLETPVVKFLGERQIRYMLMILGRDLPSFKAAKDQVAESTFPKGMEHYASIWSVLQQEYTAHKRLPTEEELKAELELWLEDALPDERQFAELSEMVDEMHRMPVEEVVQSRQKVLGYLRKFLNEAIQRDARLSLVSPRIELPKLMEEFAKKSVAVSNLGVSREDLAFPEHIRTMKVIEKFSTGCKFLDWYMNGGQAAGEVYGFGAPVGVCKTLIGVQLACERVKHAQTEMTKKGWRFKDEFGEDKLLPVVYLVMYEEELASVQCRSLSYTATIEKTIIEEGRWEEMSTSARQDYKRYERRIYADELAYVGKGGDIPYGESERLDIAKRHLTRNLRFVDFTGDREEYQEMAGNYVDGIVAYIERDQERLGNPGVSIVIIDYAGACADRHCQAHGLDQSKSLRHLIGKMPMRCKNQLAIPYKCPVWVLHQASTEANSKSPGQVPKITDTAEARNFFENCNFGFLVGTKTNDSLAILASVKQRREAKMAETVIKIDGLFSRVLDTANAYRLDNSKIVAKSEYSQLADMGDDEGTQNEADYEGGARSSGIIRRADPDVGVE